MQSTLDIIFNKLTEHSGGDTPFTDMSDDIGRSPYKRTEDLQKLINTIEKFRNNRASDNEMYTTIQNAFNTYVDKQPNTTIHFANITIDMVVRPSKCKKSNSVVKLNKNEVYELEYFYRPILFLVMLLYMNKKNIPEEKFFGKTTGIFQKTRVTLYEHLVKKQKEQGAPCAILFQKLIDVYNFVYPVKSNLAIRMPQEGARRTRYRKRKGKARARKTRRRS